MGWGRTFAIVLLTTSSFIDNVVTEGNHVWNYNTKPTSATDPPLADYFPGGSKTIEPWFFGALANDQGASVDPPTPGGPFDNQLALNRFVVFRANFRSIVTASSCLLRQIWVCLDAQARTRFAPTVGLS